MNMMVKPSRSNESQVEIIETVEINRIVQDPNLQVRKKLNDAVIKRYAEVIKADQRMPPIAVAHVEGMYLLVDGWHRIAALRSLGRSTIFAKIVAATKSEAKWMAAKANLEHGLQLKRGELRNVFRAYVNTRQHLKRAGVYKSYREIGAELGKPHTTVRNWMEKDFPKVFVRMGGGEAFGDGGLQPTSDTPLPDEADRLICELSETFRSSSDPAYRGHVIAEVRTVLGVMEASGGWTERPPEDF